MVSKTPESAWHRRKRESSKGEEKCYKLRRGQKGTPEPQETNFKNRFDRTRGGEAVQGWNKIWVAGTNLKSYPI